jgi:murein DD-endopeptidase MepM/ murein hydrolase activator NlpD
MVGAPAPATPDRLSGPGTVPINQTMRRAASLALAAALAVLVLTLPAVAQEDPTTTTSSTTTTTPPSTLLPGDVLTTTTTMAPAEPTPEDPVADENAAPEEVPLSEDTVPERPPDASGTPVNAAAVSRVIRRELRVARAEALQTQAAFDAARTRVDELTLRLMSLEQSIAQLGISQQAAIRRLDKARRLFQERAADALMRGVSGDLESFLSSDDLTEAGAKNTLMGSVLDADEESVQEFVTAKKALDDDLERQSRELTTTKLDLELANVALVEAAKINDQAQFSLAVFAAGGEIVINGFVFPVDDPHSFGNSFGAPRMTGTEYQHSHQGTDILAPAGTNLFACERGIVTRIGSDVLGGIKLWVKGESGTYYYYAHLTGYAEGMTEGRVVEAGDIVGFVGTTGNARGGVPHLHFEIHPDGGAAVNPYPLLKVVDDLRKQQAKSG